MSNRSRVLLITLSLFFAFGAWLLPSNAARLGGNLGSNRLVQGLTPVHGRAVNSGESAPVKTLAARLKGKTDVTVPAENKEINELNEGDFGTPDPAAKPQRDGALQPSLPLSAPSMPTPSLQFEGLSAASNTAVFGTTFAPPDPTGAVGPNDYVQTTNTLVRIYDKNGVPRGAAFKLSSLFASLGGVVANNDQGDTIVLYDRMANRWLISQFAFASQTAPPYHQAIAVSKTSDPTGAYWVYDFIVPGNNFNDYFKFGAWPDAYYMTDRQFTNGGPFNSFGCFAFDRSKMLVGDPTASFVYFNLGSPIPRLSNASSGMIPTDFNGLTPPPAGAPNVFAVYTDNAFTGDANDAVRLFNFHVDFSIPGNSTFLERSESPLLVAGFDSRNPNGRSDIEQPPPANLAADSLDSIGDRLMLRLQYLNRGGTESLLLCHTVNAGTIPAPGLLPTRAQYKAGTRYYEFRKTSPGGMFTVPEQATFSPDANERWMGSVAMDNAGDIAVGYSISSTTVFPSIAYAGRLATDTPGGLFQGEATLFTGAGVQIGTGNRWGDYTSLQLDPTDDATFWYVNEYYATSPAAGFDWHTRIGRFKFAGTVAPPQGTLSGTVIACDTGLSLADALVEVSGGPSTGFSSATKPDGTYSMNLSPGTYSATIGDPAHNCNAIGPFTVVITDGGVTILNGCLIGIPKFAFISSSISGGNGDGTIDKNECNNLDVTIQNIGCLVAPGVTGTLSTSTPDVTITQPNTTFPTMNENANGTSQVPFAVSTSPSFVCGTPINFILTITSPLGGSVILPFTLPTCVVSPVTINGALTVGDLQQNARLGRNGIASVCGTLKANPGTLGAGPRLYDIYSFTNGPTAACVTVRLTPSCSSETNPIISVAYLTSFNPANITQNYRGDPGGSPATGSPNSFSVDVPANATLLVNVHEINPGLAGCSGYTLTVSGLVGDGSGTAECVACTLSCPADITQANDPNQCGAIVNYATTSTGTCGVISCSPPSGSFFPKGTTTVTCNATAGNSCSFTVTVNDTQAPVVTCNVATTTLWPNNHDLINVGLSASASDNCPGTVISVAVFGDENDEEDTGDGINSPDAKNIAVGTLRLRAERKEDADGRVYLIIVTATDASGNVARCCRTVTVTHDQSKASKASVAAQAAAAKSYCELNGTAPPGYFVIGDGPIVGPKQ